MLNDEAARLSNPFQLKFKIFAASSLTFILEDSKKISFFNHLFVLK